MKPRTLFYSNAVWPPAGVVMFFAFGLGALEFGLWTIEHSSGSQAGEISTLPEIRMLRSIILSTAACVYALYRFLRFHPECDSSYAAWLASTPWTARKPLPLGPVHPVLQDAVVLGILAALTQWYAYSDPFVPAAVCGLTYLVAMTLLLAYLRMWGPCLALGFLWPAFALTATRAVPTAAVFLAIIITVWLGHRQCLRTLASRRSGLDLTGPLHAGRPKSLGEIEIRIPGLGDSSSNRTPSLGWPLHFLSPKISTTPIRASTSVAVSAMFGWWTFCVMIGAKAPPDSEVVLLFSAIMAVVRIVIYTNGLTSPINLWGRIARGRFLVPGFDQVFAAPLVAMASAIAGGILIRHTPFWHPATTGLVIAWISYVLLNGGPSLRRWVLTGQHRCRPPSRLGSNKMLLRPI